MKAKKVIALWMAFCLLFTGCASSQTDGNENTTPAATEDFGIVDAEQPDDMRIISPLPDTTMENLTDSILSVSLAEGSAYVDDQGRMQMDLKIYAYDQYDMVDIVNLKVGDTLVRHNGEVKVTSKEQNEAGTIFINGGLDNGGFNLVTDDCGTFYEMVTMTTKTGIRSELLQFVFLLISKASTAPIWSRAR